MSDAARSYFENEARFRKIKEYLYEREGCIAQEFYKNAEYGEMKREFGMFVREAPEVISDAKFKIHYERYRGDFQPEKTKDCIRIYHLMVEPRGRGWGTKLMIAMLKILQELKYDSIVVEVFPYNGYSRKEQMDDIMGPSGNWQQWRNTKYPRRIDDVETWARMEKLVHFFKKLEFEIHPNNQEKYEELSKKLSGSSDNLSPDNSIGMYRMLDKKLKE
ncbi:MAG: GNAT family N-acetyltransferase [Candidatus Heimdallarchaeota archaeon]|nr:GNAT family N-acetyltransferase [Candidatus Heimdallarchaeota archaeon]